MGRLAQSLASNGAGFAVKKRIRGNKKQRIDEAGSSSSSSSTSGNPQFIPPAEMLEKGLRSGHDDAGDEADDDDEGDDEYEDDEDMAD